MSNTSYPKFQAMIGIIWGVSMLALAMKMFLERYVSDGKYLIAFGIFVLVVIVSAIWIKLRPILGLPALLIAVTVMSAILLFIETISSINQKELLQFMVFSLCSAMFFSEGVTTYPKVKHKQ